MNQSPQSSIDEMTEMFKVLFKDICNLGTLAFRENSPIIKRAVARAVFSFIEGVVYQMKQKALAANKTKGEIFSPGEVSILKEISFEIEDSGKVSERQKFVSTMPNIKFAFASFAKAHGCEYTVDCGKKGWESLNKANGIRNRLMHPKRCSDLDITNQELKTLAYASNWFLSVYSKLQTTIIKSYYKKLGKENDGKAHAIESMDSLKKIIPWIEEIE